MKLAWIVAGLLVLALPSQDALAQSCSASATSLNFGQVSPIRENGVSTTGTVTVTCNWQGAGNLRNARICLNLGSGSAAGNLNPRSLANGAHRMAFDLYQDAAHSQVWGSVQSGNGTSPIVLTATRGTGNSTTSRATFYGRIMPNQPTVPSVNNANTVYLNAFSGAQTSINVEFYASVPRSCAAIATSSGTFPFTATATVINECTINTTNVNFGSAGVLNQALNATGALSVRCTNGDAYRVALNGGSSGNVAARYMTRATGASIVSYQLYTDVGRNLVWGDGTAGTNMVTGTGTGRADTLTIHGRVPAQRTPPPGAYRDTITATISF